MHLLSPRGALLGTSACARMPHRGLPKLDRRPPPVPVSAPDAADLLRDDSKQEFFWPQSAGIPEETLEECLQNPLFDDDGGVIRGRLGLLSPLILRTGNLRAKKVPAGIRFDHDLVPHGVAWVVMSAPHRKATVCCYLSIEAGRPRAWGRLRDTAFSKPAHRPYADDRYERGYAAGMWIRGTCSEQRAASTAHTPCRHVCRFSPADKGECCCLITKPLSI